MSSGVDVDLYLPFLERLLTPPRLQHSLNVMHVMSDLAKVYSLDHIRATTAGLLHDAAKDLQPDQQLALVDEAGIQLCYPCERHPVYLHAIASACLISGELGITNRLLLGAISVHSYAGNGPNFDNDLSRCLRSADILAPIRGWRGMKKLRSLVYAGRLEDAALLQSHWLIEYFQQLDVPIHPLLHRNHEQGLRKLAISDDFFERW